MLGLGKTQPEFSRMDIEASGKANDTPKQVALF